MRAPGLALAILLLGVSGAEAADVNIAYVRAAQQQPERLTWLDPDLSDLGLAGARLGIADSETTARFTGFHLRMREVDVDPSGAAAISALGTEGVAIAGMPHDMLLKLADRNPQRLVINAGSTDDALRGHDCRPNLLHTIPSRAMLADALAQFLMAKNWSRWALVVGPSPEDGLFAGAVAHAAEKFGATIVERKPWTLKLGAGRSDTGHVSIQSEVPAFTRMADHDVLVVADEAGDFGDYLPYRTDAPRPVAGTQGLVTTGWSPVLDQWGAAQLQQRFLKLAGRPMAEADYAAWLAVMAVSEAANRTASADPAVIAKYIRSGEFALAGFKGEPLSFRAWDGQMRQPILLAGPRLLVSVSPQPGYLHEGTALDSLGDDAGTTTCAH